MLGSASSLCRKTGEMAPGSHGSRTPAKRKLFSSQNSWEGFLFALLEACHQPLRRITVTDRAGVGGTMVEWGGVIGQVWVISPAHLPVPHELEEWNGVGEGFIIRRRGTKKACWAEQFGSPVYCLLKFPWSIGCPHYFFLPTSPL